MEKGPLGDRSNVPAHPPPSRLRKPKAASRLSNPETQPSGTGARGSDDAAPVRPVGGGRRRVAATPSVTTKPKVVAHPRKQQEPKGPTAVDMAALEERVQKQLEEKVQLQLAQSEVRMKEALVTKQAEAMMSSTQMFEAFKTNSSSLQEDRGRLASELAALHSERERLERRLVHEEQRVDDLRQALAAEKDRTRASASEVDEARRRAEDLLHRSETAEGLCREHQAQLRALEDRLRDVESAEARCRELEAALTAAEELHRRVEQDAQRREAELTECTQRRNELSRRVQDQDAALEDATSRLRRAERELRSTEGRLEDCERERSSAQKQLQSCQDQFELDVASLRTARQVAEDAKNAIETQLRSVQAEADDGQERIQALETELRRSHDALRDAEQQLEHHTKRIESLQGERDDEERLRRRVEADLEDSRRTAQELHDTIRTQDSAAAVLRAKVSALEDGLRAETERLQQEEQLRAALEQRCGEQEQQIREDEQTRRKLHNLVQELKGNIRVYCRVRPELRDAEEGGGGGDSPSPPPRHSVLQTTKGKTGIDAVQPSTNVKGEPLRWSYQFDRVFGEEATQEDVFDEVSQVVQSALDGYRVCLFAYGQTGSGKTHTMLGGSPTDERQFGVIPRSIKLVFEEAERLKAQDWSFSLTASFLEIYNETIRDLLCRGTDSKQHVIKLVDGKSANTYVTDLTTERVESLDHVQTLIARSIANRATAVTNCNERSSRSHSIFRLVIEGRNAETGQSLRGLLNLIDLAGSERLNSSGSTGDRLKETQHINKSLSALGDVIAALANREKHVPFRNSKLTHILQDSLGGDCKTLMFVNLSPTEASFQESLCSLRFASKVNSCDIGTARRSAKIDLSDLSQ